MTISLSPTIRHANCGSPFQNLLQNGNAPQIEDCYLPP
jgi:hypothetical protein